MPKKIQPYKMTSTTTDGSKVEYSVDLSQIDWVGILNLVSGFWKPGKWKKLAEQLIAMVKELWEDVVAAIALIRDVLVKLDAILEYLKNMDERVAKLEGGE